jgi:hypothetical protein
MELFKRAPSRTRIQPQLPAEKKSIEGGDDLEERTQHRRLGGTSHNDNDFRISAGRRLSGRDI